MSKDYSRAVDLDDLNSPHARMIEMVGEGKRVVDFGCSTGAVAKVLKGMGCSVTGIERDPEAAEEAAAHCDRIIVADLEGLDLAEALGGGEYDVGLFGDVIEHLKAPGRLLSSMRALLDPGGYVVLSVPNIAHASIRLMLLRGRFDYEQTGILDDTHLRFFTRDSIRDLLESCGYLVGTMDWTEQVVSREEIAEALDPLGLANLEKVAEAFSTWEAVAFQYVIKAFPAGRDGLVRRLSEEKIEAERRLRTLEREIVELRKLKDYARRIEEAIEKKNAYIEQLEDALAERDRAVAGKDARIVELESMQERSGSGGVRSRRLLRRPGGEP